MPYSALNSNYWRLNFENPSIGSRVMWRQHYDIQTDRHTDIHTDIHTYRQTDGTKLLYRLHITKYRMISYKTLFSSLGDSEGKGEKGKN